MTNKENRTYSQEYKIGYAHGSTGEYSQILEDQSLAYYDGVRDGMADYDTMNPIKGWSYFEV